MLRLRRADDTDWARLYAWRNGLEARAQFTSQKGVTLTEHLNWLNATLVNPDIWLGVGYDAEAGCHIGTARADRTRHNGEHWAECSITIEPRVRGRGYAPQLIEALVDVVHREIWPDVLLGFRATIKVNNYASLRAFVDAKFVLARATATMATLERAL